MNILAPRWFPNGDIGVGVLLSSHIGSIFGLHWQYWHWLHIGTQLWHNIGEAYLKSASYQYRANYWDNVGPILA